ncbi:thioesterase domain-containing protein [Sphaerisporangium sp. NPDC051011]|uniref:thioesterase domain-containing protein n=1 Tax=Sphaerisporangium sp. NPDC051011 TaxID=3155792 RepID=UPI0033FFD185
MTSTDSQPNEDKLSKLSPERRKLYEQMLARRAQAAAVRDSQAVVMRPGTEPRTLVLMNPSGGALFCYVPLTRALREGFPVLGCLSRPGDRAKPIERRLVDVGARILDELAAELDPSTCVFAGWSFGGCLAFEVARQHAERTGARQPVMIFDAEYAVDLGVAVPDEEELRRQFVYDVSRLQGVPTSELGWLVKPLDSLSPIPDMLARAGVSLDLSEEETADRYHIFAGAAEALYRYHPPAPYDGPVYALMAGAHAATTEAWRRQSTGEFHHLALSGDHYSVFDERNLPRVAHAVEEALARV